MEWYYWVVIFGFLIVMYAFLILRQRRQAKQAQEVMETFKVGDKVITHIGIYGKIKRIYNTTFGKVCVLEIGTSNKIDVELDMRFIAGIDEKTLVADEPKKEESTNHQNLSSESLEQELLERINEEPESEETSYEQKQEQQNNKKKKKK